MANSPNSVWLISRSIFVAISYIVTVTTIHVRAEDTFNQMSFARRLQQGPDGLTMLDLLLFGVVVMIGFEIMSYVALHTGEWISAKRIPVRGKHLDDLGMVRIRIFNRHECF